MNHQNTWWQTITDAQTRVGKKAWIIVGVMAFALVAIVAGKALWTPIDRGSSAFQDQEDKIRDMEDRVARLQRELEDASKQIASLQSGSDENTRARQSDRRRANNSRREDSRRADQVSSPEPIMYETARNTSVFEEPSASSRKVATIPRGSRVRVVGSTGDWLEVRSKQGRPPGFILKEDAVLMR